MVRSIFSRIKGGTRATGLTGISLSPHGVAVAQTVRDTADHVQINTCAFSPAQSVEEQGKALQELVKTHQLAGRPCALALEPGSYTLLQVDKPPVEAAELRDALRWRVKELLDYPVEEAVIDAFAVPGQEQRGRAPSVYVVAARKAQLQPRIDMIEAADLKLEQIDIAELALRNLVSLTLPDEEPTGVLLLTPQRGLIAIMRGKTLFVARGLDQGLPDLIQDPSTEATDELSLASNKDERYGQVALEIQRTMDYYDSYFGQAPVRRVMIVPGLPALSELAITVGEHLGLKAALLDVTQGMGLAAGVEPQALNECTLAVGASLNERVAGP